MSRNCKECGKEIARRTFCSKQCSGRYRSKNVCLITEGDLIREYTQERLELVEIAQKHGVSITTVYKYLKKFGILCRGGFVDFAGRKIGKLLILEPLATGHKGGGKHIKWKCVCECGKEHIAFAHHLVRCMTAQCTECSHKAHRSSLELKKYMWSNIRRSAVNRGLEFSIDRDWAYKLFLKQGRCCALSGVEIRFAQCAAQHAQGETTASLDRIDSSRGYLVDNVQWIHKTINFMKQSLQQDDFVEWCRKVVKIKDTFI